MSPIYVPGKVVLRGPTVAPLLLDSYSGAAAAYSLRQLSWAYGGPVVRVRRSNDNAEQDFTATEVSDGTLAAWVGVANTGRVSVWYDQSNGSNNAVQTTFASQPTIFTSGALVSHAGNPGISFNGSTGFLNANHLIDKKRLDIYTVKQTTDTSYILFGSQNSLGHSFVASSGSASAGSWSTGNAVLYANGSQFTGSTRNDYYLFLDGYKLELHQNAFAPSPTWNTFQIGRYGIGGFEFTGIIQEIIFFGADKSASRTAIEANINAHYSIYP